MSDSEVRYHYLRPKQIIEKRKEFPVAYIPIGTIEWHGGHMPTGADGIQAEGLAELCAKKGGVLVFPTLYYGERRLESIMEADEADNELIAEDYPLIDHARAAVQQFNQRSHSRKNGMLAWALEACARIVVEEVKHRINHKSKYKGHGWSLQEGQ